MGWWVEGVGGLKGGIACIVMVRRYVVDVIPQALSVSAYIVARIADC